MFLSFNSLVVKIMVLKQSWRLSLIFSAVIIGLSSLMFNAVALGQGSEDVGPAEVTIDRIPVDLLAPKEYRVRMVLRPINTVAISAQTHGVVNEVFVKNINETVKSNSELLRLKSEERILEQAIAKAKLAAAKAGSGGDEMVAVAMRELELAEFRVQQTVAHAPINGTVASIDVVRGQFVREGDPLFRLIDTSQLMVDIPIERKDAQPGDSISVTVEGQKAAGTIQAILPAMDEFMKLQDLFVSAAVARVVIQNPNGQFSPGQAVYSEMIPRHPVMEVANASVKNGLSGERKVQIVRNGFIHDLPIVVLGSVGATHVFVSGRFGRDDELIVSSSIDLQAGSYIQSALISGTGAKSGSGNARPNSTIPNNAIPGGAPSTRPSTVPRSKF